MDFYTSVSKKGNKLLVRAVIDGKRVNFTEDYRPILFVSTSKPKDEWKSLFGKSVDVVEPGNMKECDEFAEKYKGVQGFNVYGNDFPYKFQYINRQYPGQVKFDKSLLSIWSIDIETTTENGFPKIINPIEEINVISMVNMLTGDLHTFLYKTAETVEENSQIHLYSNEKEMLIGFLQFWRDVGVDIISGWNSEYFDLPYLTARLIEVLGPKVASTLSPFGNISQKTTTIMDKEIPYVDIHGVAQLDYLALYKKFTYVTRESYKLDHIAEVELNKNKLNHDEYLTFKDFYTNGWDAKFVHYNQIDAKLIKELDDKIKLIDLALMLAYMAKVNYDDVFSPVVSWDAIIHNYLWDKKVCVPNKHHDHKEPYEGAYVQEPIPGLHKWTSSFDATSLYPSIIQAWNISPETFLGVDTNFDPGYNVGVDVYLNDPDFVPTVELIKHNITMSCNGARYSREKKGIIPEIIDYTMALRKGAKDRMLFLKQEKEKCEKDSPEYKRISNDIAFLDVLQLGVKIYNNSVYGAMGNEHFRYYNIAHARAITLAGQYIIRNCGKAINEKLVKKFGIDPVCIYCDTDSLFITFGDILDKNFPKADTIKKIDIMNEMCEKIVRPVINKSCDELQARLNCYRNTISFKREFLGDKVLFQGKKRYIVNVYDNEGVRYKEPYLKIMGIEVVKSSTPKVVRKALEDSLQIMLHGTEVEMKEFVDTFKSKFQQFSVEEIAFPRGANNLDQYVGKPIYRKGTPLHIKCALIHNHMVSKLGLTQKYSLINSGEKIKFVYLLDNKMKEESIGFIGQLPPEFGLHSKVDYDTMFEKAFLKPLNGIVEKLGWNIHEHATLSDFF